MGGWDDELNKLTIDAYRIFGEAVMQDVLARALSRVMTQRPADRALLPPDVPMQSTICTSDGQAFSMSAFYEMLRIELRHLMAAH